MMNKKTTIWIYSSCLIISIFVIYLAIHEYSVFVKIDEVNNGFHMSFDESEPLYYPEHALHIATEIELLYTEQQKLIETLGPDNDNGKTLKQLAVVNADMKSLLIVDGEDLRIPKDEKLAELKQLSYFSFLYE